MDNDALQMIIRRLIFDFQSELLGVRNSIAKLLMGVGLGINSEPLQVHYQDLRALKYTDLLSCDLLGVTLLALEFICFI